MENFLAILALVVLTYIGVHGVFYIFEILEQRSVHRRKLRQVLGLHLNNGSFKRFKKEPSF